METKFRKLVQSISFKDLGYLGPSIKKSLEIGIRNNFQFNSKQNSKYILWDAVKSAIIEIERRGELIRRFLLLGPYEYEGKIPEFT